MTGLPLARLEAKRLIDDYRLHVWPAHTFDVGQLAAVLAGHPDDTACRILDDFDHRLNRPPTPAELETALDRIEKPDAIAAQIANARQIIANARDRRAQDHAALLAAANERRTA